MKYLILKVFTLILTTTLAFTGCGGGGGDSGTSTTTDGGSDKTYLSPTTTLEWQHASSAYSGTWQESVDYCEDLSWAGKTDWRLPSLESLYADYENFDPFRSGIYWSSFEISSSSVRALWGGTGESAKDGSFLKTEKQSTYCVRGTYAGANKTAESFSDTESGLEWMMLPTFDNSVQLDDAVETCNGLVKNTQDDWRLPSIGEAYTLQRKFYDIYPKDTLDDYHKIFWSSTQYDDTHQSTFTINWNSPTEITFYVENREKTQYNSYLCVRGTQKDRVVVDDIYSIEWQDSYDNVDKELAPTIDKANEYCENLLYDEKNDWYLPNTDITSSKPDDSLFYYQEYWTNSIYINSTNLFGNLAPRCIRGGYFANNPNLHGLWAYVDDASTVVINKATFFKSIEIIDTNHIKVVNSNDVTRHLIRAGVPDVKLNGEIATLTTATSAAPSRLASSFTGIGSLEMILRNHLQNEERKVSVVPTTDDNLVGTITPATTTTNETLYVKDPTNTNGRLVIPRESNLTMPTGDTEVTLIQNDNNATFNVSVIGEETDMGILTVTDKAYNFKSYMESGNDWRYFGYNDGETSISYIKTLKICNIGTADISGVSFNIALDSNSTDINRTFSTNYDNSAVPFASGECKSYDASFSFTRPTEDKDFKINITINDNFNALTWNDYASIKVSKYPHHNLYFNSNTKTLNGFLVTPGRNLINVSFSNSSYNNFVRVPLVQTDEYDVVISTPNITDEDVYMISSGVVPDTTKMNGFTNVTANEPDNNEGNATKLALYGGESVAYLAQKDIDFYKIVDKPAVANMVANAYVDFNISIPMTTEMNASTITNSTVTLTNGSSSVSGSVSYDGTTKTIIFDPDANLSAGTHTITLSKDVESATGYKLDSDVSWDINILDYPNTAQVISNYSATLKCVAISGSYAYAADNGYYGLQIINISDPSSPTLTANIDIGHARSIAISGSYAYAADTAAGLKIIDISNPKSPTLTATLDTSGSAYGVAISGGYAYVADGNSGLQIIDISNPNSPTLTATLDTSGTALGVTISGNYAYVADGDSGLHIIDISDPSSPTLTATLDTSGYAYGITISGNYAYVADYTSGLQIIDISNPSSPTLTATVDTSGSAEGVTISGNYAYVADGSSGLQIIDISIPSSPTLTATVDTPGSASKVDISGNFAYVADEGSGLQIINIQMYK
ncbi:DUF1566 domain-containing protein [Sulfurimonas aquatica]|uniref:DUF1566 domain-containing protein n=1 Tax=Sulfurimonas aquatica TaxID=2672570 RepID=A0A975B126_9BACT|nr:DUF1566 domain-containing protein [Sulfurimonas aquatica]QSZ42281.1 DUF1566 domain-containing protein [Sulfurimonas aquatica]